MQKLKKKQPDNRSLFFLSKGWRESGRIQQRKNKKLRAKRKLKKGWV